MTIETNVVYEHLLSSSKRITIEQGGTRSGKTYNILLWIITDYLARNTGKVVSIVRETYPALRASVMRDFLEIMDQLGYYREENHNKSNSEYYFRGNIVEFFGMDQPHKVRGRKRDLLFINEAIDLRLADWRQLVLRTKEKIIIDYNPSEEFHWIYDEVVPRDDAEFYQTTYLDNPFLDDSLIQEIERYKTIDPDFWNVYGLGERGKARNLIFNFHTIGSIPEDARWISRGLDFGFAVDPTAIVDVYRYNDGLIFDEVLYQTGMTGADIATFLDHEIKSQDDEHKGWDKRAVIWADSAQPETIETIRRRGWNIKKVNKPKGSIESGIDLMREHKLYWTSRSVNGIKEGRNYKYHTDKEDRPTGKPIDLNNHLMDACRYAVFMTMTGSKPGVYAVR